MWIFQYDPSRIAVNIIEKGRDPEEPTTELQGHDLVIAALLADVLRRQTAIPIQMRVIQMPGATLVAVAWGADPAMIPTEEWSLMSVNPAGPMSLDMLRQIHKELPSPFAANITFDEFVGGTSARELVSR